MREKVCLYVEKYLNNDILFDFIFMEDYNRIRYEEPQNKGETNENYIPTMIMVRNLPRGIRLFEENVIYVDANKLRKLYIETTRDSESVENLSSTVFWVIDGNRFVDYFFDDMEYIVEYASRYPFNPFDPFSPFDRFYDFDRFYPLGRFYDFDCFYPFGSQPVENDLLGCIDQIKEYSYKNDTVNYDDYEWLSRLNRRNRVFTDELSFLERENEIKVAVWNVGQGSTNTMECENEILVFDYGASVKMKKEHCKNIVDTHRSLFEGKGKIVLIISHWDSDHYNLLTVEDYAFFKSIDLVICSDDIRGTSANQIAKKIYSICGNVKFMHPYKRRYASHNIGIKEETNTSHQALFVGECAANRNLSGLMFSVRRSNEILLLTGDHSNYQVWGEHPYNRFYYGGEKLHVVVPHHGGYCGNQKPFDGHTGFAIVSTGPNPYGHPKSSVLDDYYNANYYLQRTDWWGKDFIFTIG